MVYVVLDTLGLLFSAAVVGYALTGIYMVTQYFQLTPEETKGFLSLFGLVLLYGLVHIIVIIPTLYAVLISNRHGAITAMNIRLWFQLLFEMATAALVVGVAKGLVAMEGHFPELDYYARFSYEDFLLNVVFTVIFTLYFIKSKRIKHFYPKRTQSGNTAPESTDGTDISIEK